MNTQKTKAPKGPSGKKAGRRERKRLHAILSGNHKVARSKKMK